MDAALELAKEVGLSVFIALLPALVPTVVGLLLQWARRYGVEISLGQQAALEAAGLRAVRKIEEWDKSRQKTSGVKLSSEEKEQYAVADVLHQMTPKNVIDAALKITRKPTQAEAIDTVKASLPVAGLGATAKKQQPRQD